MIDYTNKKALEILKRFARVKPYRGAQNEAAPQAAARDAVERTAAGNAVDPRTRLTENGFDPELALISHQYWGEHREEATAYFSKVVNDRVRAVIPENIDNTVPPSPAVTYSELTSQAAFDLNRDRVIALGKNANLDRQIRYLKSQTDLGDYEKKRRIAALESQRVPVPEAVPVPAPFDDNQTGE